MADRNITPRKVPGWLNAKFIIIGIIVLAILIFAGTSFYIVDQTEQAVVLTFGKYTATTEPGLHYKLPFGIQQNFNVATQVVQTEEFGFRTESAGVNTKYSTSEYPQESTMLTGDLNIIDVEWIIQYRIVDPKAWLFNLSDRHQTIRDISQSVINNLVGDRAILDVMGPERTAIQAKGADMMNAKFKQYVLGINVIAVQLQNIIPPKGVQDAFEDVNKAIQDMNRLINEGMEQYNKEIPKATGEKQQMIQIATGYATERVNEAKGDVARFESVLTEYRKAPEVTKKRLYYEMMEEIFKDDTGTDLIDRKLQNFLPIKNLGVAQGTTSAQSGQAAANQ
jgi:membrane protease subunit HflK